MVLFWWIVVMGCLVWYSTITIYISIRGVRDIRSMLSRLKELNEESEV